VTVTEPPAITTSAPVSSPSPVPVPTATGPTLCRTADLGLSLGGSDGAAGSSYTPIRFTNHGAAACTLHGYPGVSFVAGDAGTQVGPAASEDPGGMSVTTVTIAPGAVASAVLQTTQYLNYPAVTCRATAVRGLRIYPPGNTAAGFLSLPAGTMACAGTRILSVQPVQAGNGSTG